MVQQANKSFCKSDKVGSLGAHLVQDRIMILIVSVFVEMQLDDVLQLQRLPRNRMLLEFLNVWYNVCDVVHSAISSACLRNAANVK